jgi:hypothetical protein
MGDNLRDDGVYGIGISYIGGAYNGFAAVGCDVVGNISKLCSITAYEGDFGTFSCVTDSDPFANTTTSPSHNRNPTS